MKIGSLCAGVGGLELGLEWAGLGETVFQVEIDPFCRRILSKHWPKAKRYEDVTKVGKKNLERVDLICGGFPCQDISSAGKQTGLGGARSGLFYECARVVEELTPDWVVLENVASGAKLWVDTCCRELERLGYACLPVPLSARDVGALHIRARIFIVAHADRERQRALSGFAEVAGTSEVARQGAPNADSEQLRHEQQWHSRRGDGVRDERQAVASFPGWGGLSPKWCEWLMGFPKDWTAPGCEHWEMPLFRNVPR